jgi:hypothetical protein
LPKKHTGEALDALLLWLCRRGYEVLTLPPSFGKAPAFRSRKKEELCRTYLIGKAADYGLETEGILGVDDLVPARERRRNRELCRMDAGVRKLDSGFCPTNPDSLRIISLEAGAIFRDWPRETHNFLLKPMELPCSCPACRAFSSADQCRIVGNTTADALAKARPGAFLLLPGEAQGNPEFQTLALRKNIVII